MCSIMPVVGSFYRFSYIFLYSCTKFVAMSPSDINCCMKFFFVVLLPSITFEGTVNSLKLSAKSLLQ